MCASGVPTLSKSRIVMYIYDLNNFYILSHRLSGQFSGTPMHIVPSIWPLSVEDWDISYISSEGWGGTLQGTDRSSLQFALTSSRFRPVKKLRGSGSLQNCRLVIAPVYLTEFRATGLTWPPVSASYSCTSSLPSSSDLWEAFRQISGNVTRLIESRPLPLTR